MRHGEREEEAAPSEKEESGPRVKAAMETCGGLGWDDGEMGCRIIILIFDFLIF